MISSTERLPTTGSSAPRDAAFTTAATAVQRRLVLRKALLGMLAGWGWMAGVLVALVGLRLLGWEAAGVGLGMLLTGLWVAGVFGWAVWTKPEPYSAFAFWDKQAKRADAFANAWWLEAQGLEKGGAGGRLHWARQKALLPEALARLSTELRMPEARRLGWLLAGLMLLYVIPGREHWGTAEAKLSAEGRALAGAEGKRLAERKLDAAGMEGLNRDEKDEVQKLQRKIDETAKSLQQQEAKSAREVLTELENRARDAERLAGKLGAGENAWASEQMVAEMRKHADTAELGDAVASKNAEETGKKAGELATVLKDEKLTQEARDRFTETLKEIGGVAEPEDKERTVGKHVLAAERHLTQGLPKEAGGEFEALADKMRTLAQREKAREQLEKLAQQLRDSGSKIAGQGQQGGMQELGGAQKSASPQGQQGAQSQKAPMTAMPNAPQIPSMQLPGGIDSSQMPEMQGQGQGGSMQNVPLLTPVPGSATQAPQNMVIVPNPGGQPPKDGQPMLMVPIPGMPPGQQANAMMLMGVTPGSSGGGLEAGSGTAPMGGESTAKTDAGQSGMVNAQRNADGQSSVRTVEGQARQEAATRRSQATVLEIIATEESALDDAALPSARREQVRRYFNELRERFEGGGGS